MEQKTPRDECNNLYSSFNNFHTILNELISNLNLN